MSEEGKTKKSAMYRAPLMGKERKIDSPDLLPKPVGYSMLVAFPEIAEKSEGGILYTDERREKEELAAIVAYVVAMGEDCYSDKERFPNGPWCEVGDWVLVLSYRTSRPFSIVGLGKYAFVNDDQIKAVVPDPTVIKREV